MYKRPEYQKIKSRLEEDRKFIQVVMGARQKEVSSLCICKDGNPVFLFSRLPDGGGGFNEIPWA